MIFDLLAERYDKWYDRHREIYEKELRLIRKPKKPSLEIGVGTGRFCEPLGIDIGIDISKKVLEIAKNRCKVIRADACNMPFKDEVFSTVYIIFTLCFLENPNESLKEAWRVLKKDGRLIMCVIPKDSGLGEEYSRKQSPFYKIAKFYREGEIEKMLEESRFEIVEVRRTKLKYSENDFVCYECGKVI